MISRKEFKTLVKLEEWGYNREEDGGYTKETDKGIIYYKDFKEALKWHRIIVTAYTVSFTLALILVITLIEMMTNI